MKSATRIKIANKLVEIGIYASRIERLRFEAFCLLVKDAEHEAAKGNKKAPGKSPRPS